jgi:3-methyladenine DNA glycosylase AlkD
MPDSDIDALLSELAAAADPARAISSAWFFKTGKGQYGEGDQFLGIKVPVQRKIALRYCHLPHSALKKLLASKIHEHRLVALEILVAQFAAATPPQKTAIFRFYLANTARVNNWDLVDGSAPYIAGEYLLTRPRAILRKLAKSRSLWERRIAIVSTFAFIRAGQTADTFAIAQMLLADEHDLIHKAVGWALREAGKQAPKELIEFLQTNYEHLPRTALRYAIERFTPAQRKRFLAGHFITGSEAVSEP